MVKPPASVGGLFHLVEQLTTRIAIDAAAQIKRPPEGGLGP
jgi:hypothetical protein